MTLSQTYREKPLSGRDREFLFLLLSSREVLHPVAETKCLELSETKLRVDRLLALCRLMKVGPLVLENSKRLKQSSPNPILTRLSDELRHDMLTRWVPQRSRIRTAMGSLSQALAQGNVPFTFLRGLHLEERYYVRNDSRICEDIDVLVPSSECSRAFYFLEKSGFSRREIEPFASARQKFAAQSEWIHDKSGIVIDLNFSLVGNGQIGYLPFDMDTIWKRASSKESFEKRLSDEDVILELLRHCCHGHDLGSATPRTCYDLYCILCKADKLLDWEYLCHQLKEVECVTAAKVFITYFWSRFLVSAEEKEYFAGLLPCVMCDASPKWLIRHVCEVRPKVYLWRPRSMVGLLEANISVAAKLWALDDRRRLARLLHMMIFPNYSQRVMVVQRFLSDRIARKYSIVAWPFVAVAILPGIVSGIAANVFLWSGRVPRTA